MKQIQKWLVICLAALMLLSGAAALAEAMPTAAPAAEPTAVPETAAEADASKAAQWTVLFYLCGTDVESRSSSASYNLEEIAETRPTSEVNFVIQTGGAKTWHAKETVGLDIATDKLQRYHYDADGFSLDEELPLVSMSEAQTLTDFITWGARSYPAEKYLLVVWDHGGGSLEGLILDELHGRVMMSLEQLEIAVESAQVPLEAIMLDACLMASVETAQALKDSAKYLIASEESVPAFGTAFQKWLQYLYDTPECDGARLGKVLCDTTQQKYVELGMDSFGKILTYSVIDLRKIDAVVDAFNKMFVDVSALLEDPELFYTFGYYTQHMQRYTGSTMVDLADMAVRARNLCLSNETAGAVLEAVDNAVLYSVKGSQRSYSHGLSFWYMPAANCLALDHYARSCKNAPYLAFLDAANMTWTAPAWVYEQTPRIKGITRADYIVEVQVDLTEDGLPQLTVTNAKNAAVRVDSVFYQYDKKSDAWLTLGKSAHVEGSFEEGVFRGKFAEEWPAFGGELCQMNITDELPTQTAYNIPFSLTPPVGGPTTMMLRASFVYDAPLDAMPTAAEAQPETADAAAEAASDAAAEPAAETADSASAAPLPDPFAGHYELYGVWNSNEDGTGIPSRNVYELNNFYDMPIHMLRERVQYPALTKIEYVRSKEIVITNKTQMETVALPKGDYALAFAVTDVFGHEQISSPVEVNWDGKTATYTLR